MGNSNRQAGLQSACAAAALAKALMRKQHLTLMRKVAVGNTALRPASSSCTAQRDTEPSAPPTATSRTAIAPRMHRRYARTLSLAATLHRAPRAASTPAAHAAADGDVGRALQSAQLP